MGNNVSSTLRRLAGALVAGGVLLTSSNVSADQDFEQWLQGLREEALSAGISSQTLDRTLGDLQPIERVVELDRRQPEFTQTFWSYLDARVTEKRIEQGRKMLHQHRDQLAVMEAAYGVPARYLVAFWGLETNYGGYMGKFSTVGSLATLAYDPRRARFFRLQLLDALRIIDQGHVNPDEMVGSWAGAMGHLQFMPATFLRYAKDGDGDGRVDLWGNLQDVFASGGHYLNNIGWKYGELWGREVRLPDGFDWSQATLKNHKSVADWAALGVTKADGRALPSDHETKGAIVIPQGAKGPAFMIYDNFDVIMDWNRSIHYAIAVGHLADRLIGLPPLRNGREADNRPLSFDDAMELQQRLNQLGFDAGEPDGVAGRKTREAVRAYQRSIGLPADGFASLSVLEYIRSNISDL